MISKRQQLIGFPFFLVFYELVVYVSNDMFLPALLIMQDFLQCTLQQAQSLVGYWMLGTFSITLLLGPIGDRYGQKPVLISGILSFLLGTLMCLCTHRFWLFVIGRVLQGSGCCSLMSAGYATVQELYEGVKGLKIISRMLGISILAPAVGPVLGSWVLLVGQWQWIFVSIFVLGCVALVGIVLYMPSLPPLHPEGLYLKASLKEYQCILASPLFLAGTACNGLFWGGLMCWITTSPVIIMEEFGIAEKYFGVLQVPIFGGYTAGALVTDYLASRVSIEKIIRLGIAICLVSAIALACRCYWGPIAFEELLLGISTFAVGGGIANPAIVRLTPLSIPYSMSCKSALFNFNGSIIATVFTFAISYAYRGNCRVMGPILLGCALGLFFLQRLLFPSKPVTGEAVGS